MPVLARRTRRRDSASSPKRNSSWWPPLVGPARQAQQCIWAHRDRAPEAMGPDLRHGRSSSHLLPTSSRVARPAPWAPRCAAIAAFAPCLAALMPANMPSAHGTDGLAPGGRKRFPEAHALLSLHPHKSRRWLMGFLQCCPLPQQVLLGVTSHVVTARKGEGKGKGDTGNA